MVQQNVVTDSRIVNSFPSQANWTNTLTLKLKSVPPQQHGTGSLQAGDAAAQSLRRPINQYKHTIPPPSQAIAILLKCWVGSCGFDWEHDGCEERRRVVGELLINVWLSFFRKKMWFLPRRWPNCSPVCRPINGMPKKKNIAVWYPSPPKQAIWYI